MTNFQRRGLILGGLATAGIGIGWKVLADGHHNPLLHAQIPSLDFAPPSRLFLGDSLEPSKNVNDAGRRYSLRQSGEFVDFDVYKNKARRLKVPLYAHGFCYSPQKDLVCGTQKWGDLAAVARYSDLSLVRVIQAPPNISWSGHSQFLHEGKTLAITGENAAKSFIFLHDVQQDFKLVETIESEFRIHEIRMLDANQALLPTMNFHKKPDGGGLRLFDFTTGKFGKRLPSTPMSHVLALGGDRYIIHGIQGENDPISVSFVDWKASKVVPITDSKDPGVTALRGEALSSGILDDEHVILTGSDCNYIFVWNYRTNRVVTLSTGEDKPFGVTVCGDKSFIISFKNRSFSRYAYDPSARTIRPLGQLFTGVGNGRHLYAFGNR